MYNLCSERQYPTGKFFQMAHYPFDDHNVPTMDMMYDCCVDMHEWMKDENHVAAVHCKVILYQNIKFFSLFVVYLMKGWERKNWNDDLCLYNV